MDSRTSELNGPEVRQGSPFLTYLSGALMALGVVAIGFTGLSIFGVATVPASSSTEPLPSPVDELLPPGPAPETPAPEAVSDRMALHEEDPLIELAELERRREAEELALAKIEKATAMGELSIARDTLAELRKAWEDWNQLLARLEHDHDGRLLSPDKVPAFLQLRAKMATEEKACREAINTMAEVLATAEQQIDVEPTRTYSVPQELLQTLANHKAGVRQITATFTRARQNLEHWVATAKLAGREPGLPLAEAIQKYQRERSKREAEQLTAALEEEIRKRTEQRIRDEKKALELKRKREALEAEFKREEKRIIQYLGVFLAPSRYSGGQDHVGEEKPESLAYIKACGGLAPDINGVRELCRVARSRRDLPLSPLAAMGGLTIQQWNAHQARAAKQAQDYLIKFGSLLVEEGLLLP